MRNKSYFRIIFGLMSILVAIVFLIWASPPLAAKEFGVVEDLYVGRNTVTPYGGIGRYGNLLTRSEEFNDSSWTKDTGITLVTTDDTSILAPDGTASAEKFTFTGASGQLYKGNILTGANTASKTFTFSIWLRTNSGTLSEAILVRRSDGSDQALQNITLTVNWQRFSVTRTFDATTTSGLRVDVRDLNAGTVYCWGAQVEEAPTPGVYAKTTSSTVSASRGIVSTGDFLMPSLKLSGGQITDTSGTVTVGSNLASTGNLQVTGAGPHYISQGNVGIGTTNPNTALEIAKSGTGNADMLRMLTSSQADGTWAGTQFGQSLADGKAGFIHLYLGTSAQSYQNSYIGIGVYGDDVPTLNIKRGGNVGIGTTSPMAYLQIGNQTVSKNGVLGLRVEPVLPGGSGKYDVGAMIHPSQQGDGGATGFTIALDVDPGYDAATTNAYAMRIYPYHNSNVTNYTGLYISGGAGAGTVTNNYALVTEAGAGNVGIGTTGPVEKLHLVGGKLRLESNAGNGYGWIYGNDTNHSIILRADRDGTLINATNYYQYGGNLSEGTKGHRFWTGGVLASQTEKMRIADDGIYMSGNVGIGTVSPSTKLHVKDPSNAQLLLEETSSNIMSLYQTSGWNSEILAGAYYNGTNEVYGVTTRGAFKINLQHDGDASPQFISFLGAPEGTAGQPVTWTEIMRLQRNGNVGIGTTGPGNALDVVGDVTLRSAVTDRNTIELNTVTGGAQQIYTSYAGTGTTEQPLQLGTNSNKGAIHIATNGNVGIGTTSPEFKLDINGDGGIIARGTYGSGASLITAGAGTRLIWYPKKAAFRAGNVTGAKWDDANIGNYSTAFGYDNQASNTYALAIGEQNTASGYSSVALGDQNTASGNYSTVSGVTSTASGLGSVALGVTNTASGYGVLALGGSNTASGNYGTTAMGWSNVAAGDYNFAIGHFVSTSTASDSYVVGHGVDTDNRITNNIANSMMIGFNSTVPTMFIGPSSGVGTTGNVGIGTTGPVTKLHIAGDMSLDGGKAIYNATAGTSAGGLRVEELTMNLATNPSIESNTTGWSTCGAGTITISRVTEQVKYGTYSLKVVTGGVNNNQGGQWDSASVSPSAIYTASAWVYAPLGQAMQLYLRDNANATGGVTTFNGTGAWQRVTVSYTMAANSTTAGIYIRTDSIAAVTFYIDGVQLEQKSYATTYADGSLGNGYTWSGTAHASNSTREAGVVVTDKAITAYGLNSLQALTLPDLTLSSGGSITGVDGNVEIGSDLRVTGDGPHYISQGNVGIGTTGPGAKLSIMGAYGATPGADAFLHANNWMFRVSNANSDVFNIDSYSATGGSWGSRVAIDRNTGNVGIGTTSPGEKLDIATATTGRVAFSYADGASNWFYPVFKDTTSGNYKWGFGVFADSFSTTDLQNSFSIYQYYDKAEAAVNQYRFFISNAGNVGIGTTGPVDLLEIYKNTNASLRPAITNPNTGVAASVVLDFNVGGSNIGQVVSYGTNWNSGYPQFAQRMGFASNADYALGLDLRADGATSDIRFYSGGLATTNERMRITSTGNVGIGTTGPNVKLQIQTATDANNSVEGLRIHNPGGSIGAGVKIGLGAGATYSPKGHIRTDIVAGGAGRMFLGTNDVDYMIIDTIGNVGIGTTSPGAKLHVGGDFSAGAGVDPSTVTWKALTGSVGEFRLYTDSRGGNILISPSSGAVQLSSHASAPIQFLIGTSEKMRVNNDGNVGIGTVTPTEKLMISTGNILLDDSVDLKLWYDSSGATQHMQSTGSLRVSSTGSGTLHEYGWGNITIQTTSSRLDMNDTRVGINTNQLYVQTSSGSVGINTTSPEARLDVEGTMQVTTAGDTGVAHDLVLTNVTSSAVKSYGPLTVQSGGSNDNYNLTLKGSGTGKVYVDDDLEITGITTFPSGLTVASGNITASTGNVSASAGSGTFGTLTVTGNANLATTSGNVGIGTTGPGAKLEVNSAAGAHLVLQKSSAYTGQQYIDFRNSSAAELAFVGYGGSTDNFYVANMVSAGDLYLTTTGAGDVIIDNGKVGIGTTGPGMKLDVDGSIVSGDYAVLGDQGAGNILATKSSANSSYFLGQSATAYGRIRWHYNATEGNSYLSFGTTGNANLVVNNSQEIGLGSAITNSSLAGASMVIKSGNVGIGTVSPLNKLHVTTTGRFGDSTNTARPSTAIDPGITIGRISTDEDAGLEFYTSGGDSGYGWLINAPDRGVNGTPLVFKNRVSSGTWTERLTFKYDGNVGIGTTDPAVKVHVYGSQPELRVESSVNSDGTFLSKTTLGSWAFGTGVGLAEDKFVIYDGGIGPRFVIDSSGNIGIGTTGPAYKLDVLDTAAGGGSHDVLRVAQEGAATGGNSANILFDASSTNDAFNAAQGRIRVVDAGNYGAYMTFDLHENVQSSNIYERMRITSSGQALIGHTVATDNASTMELFNIGSAQYTGLSMTTYHGSGFPFLVAYRSNNSTKGSHTAVNSGDLLFQLHGYGSTGSAFRNAAGIDFAVDGDVGASDMPGRISFYTVPDGTTSMTERMRITNAGSVGINTASPEAKLDVQGPLRINTAGDTGVAQDLVLTNIDASTIKSYSPLTIQSGGSNDNYNLTLKGTGTGKVYIDDDLEITGTTTFPSGLTVASGNITASTGNVSASAGSGTFGTLTVTGNANLATTSGNVGIGTTNPTTLLELYSSVPYIKQGSIANANSAWTQYKAGTAASVYIGIEGSGGGNIFPGTLGYAASFGSATAGSATHLISANAVRMTLDSTGNVGIGTTAPAPHSGTGLVMAGTDKGIIELWDTSAANQKGLIQQADAVTYIGNLGSNSGGWISGNDVVLLAGGGNPAMRILGASGNVGIGTSAPENKLHVKGAGTRIISENTSGAGYLESRSSSGAADDYAGGYVMQIKDNAGNFDQFADFMLDTNDVTNGSEDGDIYFRVMRAGTLTEQMRIMGTGNVGIGTANPTAKLHVGGDLRLENGTLYLNSARNDERIYSGGGNSVIMQTGGGSITIKNVGSGLGGITLDSGYTLASTDEDNNGSDVLIYAGKAKATVGGAGGVGGDIFLYGADAVGTGNNRGGNIILLPGAGVNAGGSGNVGIGTTNPDIYKLNVNGNTNITGTLTTTGAINGQTIGATSAFNALTVGGGYGSSGITMDTDGNLKLDGNIWVKGTTYQANYQQLYVENNNILLNVVEPATDEDAYIAVMSGGTKASPTYQALLKWNTTPDRWDFGTSTTPNHLYVSGNVGIGTTDPGSFKLAVASGNISLDGGYKLYLYGNGTTTEDYIQRGYFRTVDANGQLFISTNNGNLTNGPYINLYNGSASSGKGNIDFQAGEYPSGSMYGDINFYTNGLVLTVQDTGNVGIGTTSPLRKLHISDSGYDTQFMIERPGGDNNGKIKIKPDISPSDPNRISSAKLLQIETENNGHILLIPNGSGNVGIGTTGPGAALEISKSGSPELRITDTGTTYNNENTQAQMNFYGRYYSADNVSYPTGAIRVLKEGGDGSRGAALTFWTQRVGTLSVSEDLRITANGSVGIGTTGPLAKLDVTGSVSTASSLNVISRPNEIRDETYRADDTTGWNLYSGATVTTQAPDPANGFHTRFLRFTSDADVNTNDRIWGGAGAHTEDFVINKTYRISFMYRATNGFDIADRDVRIALLPANTGKAKYFEITWTDPDTQTSDRFHVRTGADFGGANNNQVDISELTIQNLTDDAPESRFFISGDSAGRSWINTGKVGIGTTNPSQTLDVQGTFNVSSYAYFGAHAYFTGGPITISGNSYIQLRDDRYIGFSANDEAKLQWSTAQNPDAIVWGLPDGSYSNNSRYLLFADNADIDYNFGHGAQSNPTLFIHSANQNTTQWLGLTHDGSDGVISTGTGDLVLSPASGNVGIGITVPGRILETTATNAVRFIESASNAGLRDALELRRSVTPAANDGITLLVSGNDASGNNQNYGTLDWYFSTVTNGGEDGQLAIRLAKDGTLTERVRINEDGNVGIGTTSPDNRLHVKGSAPQLKLEGSNPQLIMDDGASTQAVELTYTDATNVLRLNTPESGSRISLGAEGATALEVLNGNVGIGTGDQGYRLNVNGTIVGESLTDWSNQSYYVNPAGTTSAVLAGNVGIGTLAPKSGYKLDVTGKLKLGDSIGTTYAGITVPLEIADSNYAHIALNSPSNLGAGIYYAASNTVKWFAGSSNSQSTPIDRYTISSATVEALTILQSGSVGINTTNPEAKLDIQGPLRIGSAGDVNMAHDLYFEDITAANIKSYGPLTIQSGNPNSNYNLILKGTGTGKVYIDDDLEITGTTTFPTGLTVASGNITASSGNITATNGIGAFGNGSAAAPSITFSSDLDTGIYHYDTNSVGFAAGGVYGGRFDTNADLWVSNRIHPGAGSAATPALTFAGNTDMGFFQAANAETGWSTGGFEKIRFNSSGNVGIGTTGPVSKLEVAGDITVTGGGAFVSASELRGISLRAMGGDFIFSSNTTSGWQFRTAGNAASEVMRISSGGSVGIGTTGPDKLLQVAGYGHFDQLGVNTNDGTYTVNVVGTINTTANAAGTVPLITKGTTSQTGDLFQWKSTSATLGVIDKSGNVGIGTTEPDKKLTIVSSGIDDALRIKAGAAGASQGVVFTDNTGTNVGFFAMALTATHFSADSQVNDMIFAANNGGAFRIGTGTGGGNPTTRLVVKNDGNVGIGTTNPGAKLDVRGNVYSSNSFFPGNNVIQTSRSFGDDGTYLTATNLKVAAELNLNGQLFTGAVGFRVNSDDFVIQTPGGNSKFRFKTSDGSLWVGGATADGTAAAPLHVVGNGIFTGNVGIGTTVPSVALDVSGNLVTSTYAYLGGTTGTGLRISGTDATNTIYQNTGNMGITTNAGTITLGPGGTGNLVVNVDADTNVNVGSGKFYVQGSTGNVGIGTTGPVKPLHIRKASETGDWIRLDMATGTVFDIGYSTAGYGYINTSGTNDLILGTVDYPTQFKIEASNGNVGIGTTSPAEKLEVAGNIKLTGSIRQGSLGDVAEMMALSPLVRIARESVLQESALLGVVHQYGIASESLLDSTRKRAPYKERPLGRYPMPQPNDVVMIDRNGGIRLSDAPNSTAVIGVISANPAQILREDLPNSLPVALSGTVPCRVTCENGPIYPGDLLTSSSKPGYAMKADPPKIGTIIGKAMEPLEQGEGEILIFVTRQ